MEEINNNYNPTIGYIKSFAIILMVLGHACFDKMPGMPHFFEFVAMFHMPIFFIASGYCFKIKYINAPKAYLTSKFKGIYWPYVKWCLLFLLLHNIFFNLNLYNDQYGYLGNVSSIYTFAEIKTRAFEILVKMRSAEQLLGGYWFLNALFFGSLIAWVVIRLVNNMLFGGAILVCVCTILNKTCWRIPLFDISSRSFAAALLIIIGYTIAKYKLKPFNSWQIALGISFTLFGSYFWKMSLSFDSYSNKFFVPYILSATVATWSFYSLFDRVREMSNCCTQALTFIGKHTLTILTWHLIVFKIVSFFIICYYHLPIGRLAEFPVISEYAEKGWWFAYFIVAMIVSCLFALCNTRWIRNEWLKL